MIAHLIQFWGSLAIMVLVVVSTVVVVRDLLHQWRQRDVPLVHKCKEHGRRLCWPCAGLTWGFMAEHLLWRYAPIFAWVTHYLRIA